MTGSRRLAPPTRTSRCLSPLHAARGRTRRGVQPRTGDRHDRRRQAAGGAAGRQAHERDRRRRVDGQMDRKLPRPAVAAEPVSNVVRWELRPRLFLRTTEFLWQEGLTAHVSEADAHDYARRILHDVYEDVLVNVLGMPVVVGRKTVRERFAGATSTYTLEAMMGDGKALQMGTSHELGQNFAQAFGSVISLPPGSVNWRGPPHGASRPALSAASSWLTVTTSDSACHTRLAPVQATVLVVRQGNGVAEVARTLTAALQGAGVRAELDERVDVPFGRRAIDAELRGYPVRIEIGPRDIAESRVVLVRRVTGERLAVPIDSVVDLVTAALEADQTALFEGSARAAAAAHGGRRLGYGSHQSIQRRLGQAALVRGRQRRRGRTQRPRHHGALPGACRRRRARLGG